MPLDSKKSQDNEFKFVYHIESPLDQLTFYDKDGNASNYYGQDFFAKNDNYYNQNSDREDYEDDREESNQFKDQHVYFDVEPISPFFYSPDDIKNMLREGKIKPSSSLKLYMVPANNTSYYHEAKAYFTEREDYYTGETIQKVIGRSNPYYTLEKSSYVFTVTLADNGIQMALKINPAFPQSGQELFLENVAKKPSSLANNPSAFFKPSVIEHCQEIYQQIQNKK